LACPVIAAGVWGIQVGKLRERGGCIHVHGHRHIGESAMYTAYVLRQWPGLNVYIGRLLMLMYWYSMAL
jgi:hypothetical protein